MSCLIDRNSRDDNTGALDILSIKNFRAISLIISAHNILMESAIVTI